MLQKTNQECSWGCGIQEIFRILSWEQNLVRFTVSGSL